ncbi:MAG: hypothetical protein HKM93_08100 [Desulfobacteraceae bacterium]|nr:hypothetical protein [Desulfobacteraceae bacterium]
MQQPFVLRGSVTETHLAGVAVNDQPVTVTPHGTADTWSFSVGLSLVSGEDTLIELSAWDFAGHRTSTEFIMQLGTDLVIEIISPAAGAKLVSEGDQLDLTVTARVSGSATDYVFKAGVDQAAPVTLNRSGDTGNGLVIVDATQPGHTLTLFVENSTGDTMAHRSQAFTVVNGSTIPLEIEKQEPANGQAGVEPNEFIAFYFNKPIDPALLQVQVRETAHGLIYNTLESGADITRLNDIKLIEVHRDQKDVPGGISLLPGDTMAAFYPERDFAYNGTVFVTVSYDGAEIYRSSFKIRPLPTFIQGFVADQFMTPIPGIEVYIPEINQTAITDTEGNYGFGFGNSAQESIPGGRYRVIVNPNLKNKSFGALERWINAKQGRLNEVGITAIPILNPDEPFRYIDPDSGQAVLARGDLVLGMSDAALFFPDGRNAGSVHVQFMNIEHISYPFVPPAVPHWLFAIQPAGVEVSGEIQLIIKMPPLYGSSDYINRIGGHVVLVGFDPDSMSIVPIGVGAVNTATHTVESVGPVHMKRLDYIGYAVVGENQLPDLEAYARDEIGLSRLILNIAQ